ncbi:hypothetical protein GCM10009069_27140 [Algimonas arctica]|uniref:Uncharacterized protein n=1 Tax=Algimonas arctica TaxID=1479486 RepID=A0A8J3G376_9PROT|nr:hypothetical protein [Algimonas arctica]GHB02941.1 hypothetical protein GCM10009069_27140 [Algimonas arctica]
MKRFVLLLLATLIGSAAPAFGGEVTRESASAKFEWKSTECQRPTRPYPQRNDPTRQAQMQDFALKVAYYLDCLKGEAQRDFDRAQVEMHDAIQRNLQAETDKMNDDVERMVK